MKAYKVWDKHRDGEMVVFAESPGKARSIAMQTDMCEDSQYIDIGVRRLPEMDSHYKGRREMDWCDDDDRIALAKIGWECVEAESWECRGCPARDFCGRFVEEEE